LVLAWGCVGLVLILSLTFYFYNGYAGFDMVFVSTVRSTTAGFDRTKTHRLNSTTATAWEEEKEYIKVNPNSTIGFDVTASWHHPSRKEVCVHLIEGARCPNPDFLGRLSGNSLAMLQWRHASSNIIDEDIGSNQHRSTNVYCGSYKDQWILPGMYHLEIIITFCNGFGLASTLYRTGNLTEWLGNDFMHNCMEDPDRNRVTSVFLNIGTDDVSKRGNEESLVGGYWLYNNTKRPLHTRYQPQNCLGKATTSRCRVAQDSSNLAAMSFAWKSYDWVEKVKLYQMDLGLKVNPSSWQMLNSLQKRLTVIDLENKVHGRTGLSPAKTPLNKYTKKVKEHGGPKVCIVGASHSYHMVHAFYGLNLGHIFVWAKANFPTDLDTEFFQKYHDTRNCTKFVIGVGQWSAAFTAWSRYGSPFSFGKWWDDMSTIVKNETTSNIANGTIKLYLRTIHLSPINDATGKCKDGRPRDWRSPTVIEGYNYALKNIVANSNSTRVKFVDTNFITFPVWDMTYDFYHLGSKVAAVEALYIAFKVLIDS